MYNKVDYVFIGGGLVQATCRTLFLIRWALVEKVFQGFFDTTVFAKVVWVLLGQDVVQVFAPHASAKLDACEDSTVEF